MNGETTAIERLRACPADECPICGRKHTRTHHDDCIHDAAHCCLWKTHAHAARVRIANRVESGQDWHDAIQGETP